MNADQVKNLYDSNSFTILAHAENALRMYDTADAVNIIER